MKTPVISLLLTITCLLPSSWAAPIDATLKGKTMQIVYDGQKMESRQQFNVMRERITEPDEGILKIVRRTRAKGFPAIRSTEIFWKGLYFYSDTIGTRITGEYRKTGNTLRYNGTFSNSKTTSGTVKGNFRLGENENTFRNVMKFDDSTTKVVNRGRTIKVPDETL